MFISGNQSVALNDSDTTPIPTLAAEIAYIGSPQKLSDCLVRAFSVELGRSVLIRLDRAEDFRDLAPEICASLRLVVLDETAAETLLSQDNRNGLAFASAKVALSYHDEDVARRLLAADREGAAIQSYLPIDLRFDIWASVLRLLLNGGTYVPAELYRPALPEARAVTRPEPTKPTQAGKHGADLTPREEQVLDLVAQGLPNKLIAARLGLSEHTIKLHIHHVISKLGVSNRTEAAMRYAAR